MKLNRENNKKLIALRNILRAQKNVKISNEDVIITDEDIVEIIE